MNGKFTEMGEAYRLFGAGWKKNGTWQKSKSFDLDERLEQPRPIWIYKAGRAIDVI